MSKKKTDPLKTGGMVSPEMVEEEEGKELTQRQIAMYSISLLQEISANTKKIADALEGRLDKSQPEPQPVKDVPQVTGVDDTDERTKEIIEGFAPFGDDVTVDTEESAQFVLVKMNKFLGKKGFADIGAVSRKFGGEYVSQGKNSHFKIPKVVPKAKEQPKPKATKASPVDDAKMMFPEDLENMLKFEEREDYIKISPRQFLGSDNFAKILSIVRGMSGDYVSAGKDSHFRVPKGK